MKFGIRCGTILLGAVAMLASGCSSTMEKHEGPAVVTIIGTRHEPSGNFTPDSLYAALVEAYPDVILCELESIHFTDGDTYDLESYPDLLSTNENIASYRYQQQYGIPLRPYEMEGRNEYYRSTGYFADEERMFTGIMDAYSEGRLSEESASEWKRFLDGIPAFDVLGQPLRQLNSPISVKYSQIKNILANHTLVSVTRRDFPRWEAVAAEHLDFWERRNDAMAENIERRCRDYPGGRVVVLCGQQHKAPLISRLRLREGIILKEYWETD